MKKLLSLLLTIVLVISVMPLGAFVVSAEDTQYTEGYYTYTVSDGKATITYVDTSISGDITIPSTLGGYTVISISYLAFYDCDSLTGIIIPDSITSIGDMAFSSCNKLTVITVPDSVTNIGAEAFFNCNSLTDVSLGNNITSIEENTFYNCASLTGITIPDSVTSIGEDAFSHCDNLTSITIPDSVVSIGRGVFFGCISLTSVSLGDSVTSVGDYAFENCTGLTSITIPDSVTSIGSAAFSGCTNLTDITIPDSVTGMGRDAFENTAYYNNVNNWQNYVLYIGKHLIKAKSSISGKYTIRDDTLTIAGEAFCDCTKLTNITIPDSVTGIGCDAFKNTAYYNNANNWVNEVLYIGKHLIKAKTTIVGECTIRDDTLIIAGEAFCDCTKLTGITIPNSVISIGRGAFFWCNSLTDISLPDSVKYIGESAFSHCGVYTVIIPNGVTVIKEKTFAYCYTLSQITVPHSVEIVEYAAFALDDSRNLEVLYTGSKKDKDKMCINDNSDLMGLGQSNVSFIYATWHYNSCKGSATHTYSDECRDRDCNVCGKERIVNGHLAAAPIIENSIEHTCTQGGSYDSVVYCTVCGEELLRETVVVGAIGHTYGETTVVKPTTTEQGYSTHICTDCGYEEKFDFVDVIKHKQGDTNGDNNINNKDLGLLMQYVNNWDVEINVDAADVNNDGKVNNKDLGLLMQYVNNWNVELG